MRLLSWILLAILSGIYIVGPLEDPDLWWHLTVGRWILAHGEVPLVDLWNAFGAGRPWRAYSWSTEILLAFTEQHFSLWGLLALKLLLAVSAAVVFAFVFSRIATDWIIGLLLGVYTIAGCYNHFTLRPQSFVWIFFALLLLQLHGIAREGVSNRRLILVGCLMALWANTQITTIIGLVAIVVWLSSYRLWADMVLTLMAAIIGTICTPYVGGEWLTFFSKTSHPLALRAIAEFQPATIMQYSTGFLVVLTALILLCAHFSSRVVPVGLLIGGGGFILAALAVVKFHPFAVIFLSAVMSLIWSAARENPRELGNLGEGLHRLRQLSAWIPKEGLSFLLLVLIILQAKPLWDLESPIRRAVVPVAALDFIQKHELPQPLIHDFGRGGYVMFRYADRVGVPAFRVPIDGRTNVTPPEVWKRYIEADFGERSWHQYFDLVQPQTVLWRRDSPLLAILLASRTWCQVFESVDKHDMGYVVLVKRDYIESHRSAFPSTNCPASLPLGSS